MPYILIAVFLAGYGVAYKVDRAEIFALKNAIEKSNEQGRSAMVEAQRIVDHAHSEALKSNQELDKANESSINTINAYYDRVRSTNKPRSHCPVSKANHTVKSTKDAGNTYDLLTELHRADLAAIEKNTLLKFVKDRCGIK
jgi:hypothetical protein